MIDVIFPIVVFVGVTLLGFFMFGAHNIYLDRRKVRTMKRQIGLILDIDPATIEARYRPMGDDEPSTWVFYIPGYETFENDLWYFFECKKRDNVIREIKNLKRKKR